MTLPSEYSLPLEKSPGRQPIPCEDSPSIGAARTHGEMTMREALNQMFECLANGPEVYQPSKFWQQLNSKNVGQLEISGIENLKRTLAQNYFTWIVGLRSPLFRHLSRLTTWKEWIDVLRGLPRYSRESGLGLRRFYELQVFTRMIWKLAGKLDSRGFLTTIEEPAFGNPFSISFHNRLISQDLANSIIEIYSIMEGSNLPTTTGFTVCELGAGYGRNAYAFLSGFPLCRYIVVDIPPALYVSQEYLARVLPEKRLLRFDAAADTATLEEARTNYDIVFLLPHQLELLRPKSVDFFVNISSLHEMTTEQVEAYFNLIDIVTRGRFYTKQWKSFLNARDRITITESDYPYRHSWRKIYSRTPPSHPLFFEALFEVF